jgi:mannose-6-phosphate isomerase-like protein (cupin superfamily)
MLKLKMNKSVSKHYPLNQYKWGNDCVSWNLLEDPFLSIKQERMPAGTAEVKHVHSNTQQFFYILKGIATFESDSNKIELISGEGIHVPSGVTHRIMNNTSEDLEFLLCTQPGNITDRINSSDL